MEEEVLNLDLLFPTASMTKNMLQVISRDVFEQNSTEFKHDGLFSNTIFGEVGSKERNTTFGYVDLNIDILHPRVFKELTSLNKLYAGILDGTTYAVFDGKAKDFVEADKLDGRTGIYFFMEHYDNINFKQTDSTQREFKIKFLKKYKASEVMINKYLVIPAGLRDYKLTESGKALENEINSFYRKLLTISNSAKVFKDDLRNKDNEYVSAVRKRLQRVALEIYEFIEGLLDGKSGYIQGKWAKRAIAYGTRNVLTSIPTEIRDLDDEDNPISSTSYVGLYQAAKGLLPITVFNTRTKFLQDAFDVNSSKALLIDKKTLKRVPADISEKTRSRWVTDDGVEETINKLGQDEIKNSIVEVDGYYLLLVYDDGNVIEIYKSIENLPDGHDKSKLRPITYGELFYLSIFDKIKDYPAYVTRYPIVEYGGIIPTSPRLKSTIKFRNVKVRLPDSMEYITAVEYPIPGESWSSSLAIAQQHLEALGADKPICI